MTDAWLVIQYLAHDEWGNQEAWVSSAHTSVIGAQARAEQQAKKDLEHRSTTTIKWEPRQNLSPHAEMICMYVRDMDDDYDDWNLRSAVARLIVEDA